MEIDAQGGAEAKAPGADEGGDSWSDTSGEYSVVSDGGASASAESTTEEISKGKRLNHLLERMNCKRRFTHCPEKKNSTTHCFESWPRKTSSRHKTCFKRGRCHKKKLETIFEHPIVTADNKVVFLRHMQKSLDVQCVHSKRKFSHRFHGLVHGSCRHASKAVKKSVEEVDQLMMNLDIHQENPVT